MAKRVDDPNNVVPSWPSIDWNGLVTASFDAEPNLEHPDVVKLAIERGAEVEILGKSYVITHVLDFESVMAQEKATGKIERVAIVDIRQPSESTANSELVPDLAALDDRDWDEARRRQKIIEVLISNGRRPRSEVQAAGEELGVNAATVYRWMRIYRDGGKLSALLPVKRDGGRGRPRLDERVEQIVQLGIKEFYLTKQQRSVRGVTGEIARLCRAEGVEPPHENTVRARVKTISERTRLKARAHGKSAKDKFDARPGEFDAAKHPLAIVQIDHTKLDIALVDSQDRLPIGRPWITLAFDVFSRMVTGFSVSLDPPSAHTTGLAIAHSVLPKETWLANRGISNKWHVWGFPACIHLDNAKEFHGEMLRRACEQYGIRIDYRPVAVPHYGGHIERMMGTLMSALHELPGTTFSNPKKKGDYDSDASAVMTLEELEAWIAEYVTGVYHAKLHKGIGTTPVARWTEAIFGNSKQPAYGVAPRPVDAERIQLDFSPYVQRTIQPYGVQIHDIYYYSDVLRPYIAASEGKRKRNFIFRRDPRDISRIYFWDPELEQYSEIPYRDISKPPMSVWELREIRRRLSESGKDAVNEHAIFEALAELRQRTDRAVATTKKVRRDKERRPKVAVSKKPSAPPIPLIIPQRKVPLVPFEVEDV